MTLYYFDSSALTKRYIIETGINWVRAIVAPNSGHRILIARITPVEVMSAVFRHKRNSTITARTAQAIRFFLERHTAREYQIVQLADSVLSRAQDLLDVHPLRAFDALQLASALEVNSRVTAGNKPSIVFVCADTRLVNAATAEGLPTHIPT